MSNFPPRAVVPNLHCLHAIPWTFVKYDSVNDEVWLHLSKSVLVAPIARPNEWSNPQPLTGIRGSPGSSPPRAKQGLEFCAADAVQSRGM